MGKVWEDNLKLYQGREKDKIAKARGKRHEIDPGRDKWLAAMARVSSAAMVMSKSLGKVQLASISTRPIPRHSYDLGPQLTSEPFIDIGAAPDLLRRLQAVGRGLRHKGNPCREISLDSVPDYHGFIPNYRGSVRQSAVWFDEYHTPYKVKADASPFIARIRSEEQIKARTSEETRRVKEKNKDQFEIITYQNKELAELRAAQSMHENMIDDMHEKMSALATRNKKLNSQLTELEGRVLPQKGSW